MEKTQCSGTKQVIIENSGTGQFLAGTGTHENYSRTNDLVAIILIFLSL